MNFKKTWKRANDGFTLVELIVVIAILAILAGVAVPAYSGYIKKANMGADISLANEVANALILNYYSSSAGENTDGYVVLTTNGCTPSGAAVDAMNAVYGVDGWANLSLKYDGWTDDGLLSYVLSNADTAGIVASSPYLANNDTTELLGKVTDLTGAATTVLNKKTGDSFTNMLNSMTNSSVVSQLDKLGISKDDDGYTTAVSNLLVTHVAEELASGTENPSVVTQLALTYANLYAYASTVEGGMDEIDAINTKLSTAETQDDLWNALVFSESFQTGYDTYVENNLQTVLDNQTAAVAILGAVNSVSGQYTSDLDALKNADLYTSGDVQNHLDNYVTAVNTVANMTEDQRTSLANVGGSGSVTVLLTGGSVAITPVQAAG